ncbi:MAG: methyltransferase domain-containing protein [Giesbergeria sp.]|nr:methyltransferase domain-containing protein [Giesbergeria sp.]
MEPLDLDTLLQRLRAVSAEHGDTGALTQMQAQPWLASSAVSSAVPAHQKMGAAGTVGQDQSQAAVPWALAARAGGLGPYLVADDAGFVALAYRHLLARAPDAGGQAHLLERLRQHTPRTELLAELALSPEATALHGGQPLPWRWIAKAALWAVRSPLLRGPWLVRGVWRRSERWQTARLQRGPLGLAWQVATAQEAHHATLQKRLSQAQDSAGTAHAQALEALAQQQEQMQALHGQCTEALQHQAAVLRAESAEALQHQTAVLRAESAEALQHQTAVLRAESAEALQHQAMEVQALQSKGVQMGAEHAKALQRHSAVLQTRLQAQERRLGLLVQRSSLAKGSLEGLQDALNAQDAPLYIDTGKVDAGKVVPSAQNIATEGVSAAAVDEFLAALEVSFRGPVDALRAQLAEDYLATVQDLCAALGVNGPCLDLGCGRGVWMELLRDEGFEAQGVDLNAAAVDEARAKGLQVQERDALEWLRAQPDNSVLLVTAFHLMEHVSFALRLALVTECQRVLRPGGMLIMETPNPENIWVATHTFHHDPTHSQPLTPDSLEFLVNHCGLETVAVPRLHPYPVEAGLQVDGPVALRLNHMTCGGQDFAVLARKL